MVLVLTTLFMSEPRSYGLNIYVPPNSYVEILTPKWGDGIRKGGRWEVIGHEGGGLMNRISSLIKRPQRPFTPSHGEKAIYEPGSGH